MADESKKKGGIGSGNMSTPATTGSNASSSGYGYSPMYEALGMLSGNADTSASTMASAALGNAGQPAPNDYTDPTDMTGKSNTEIRAAAEVAAKANPFSIGGVDLGASGIGMGVSSLLSGAIGGPVGLLLGALGSWGAKKVYSEELRNQQQENFFKIIGQIDITDPAGKTGTGIAPIVDAATSTGAKADPTDTWITNYMNGITSGAANPNNFPNAVGGGDPVTDPGSIGSGTGTYSNVA